MSQKSNFILMSECLLSTFDVQILMSQKIKVITQFHVM